MAEDYVILMYHLCHLLPHKDRVYPWAMCIGMCMFFFPAPNFVTAGLVRGMAFKWTEDRILENDFDCTESPKCIREFSGMVLLSDF